MFRRSSGRGAIYLLVGIALFWIPLGSAGVNPQWQTSTLLVITLAIAGAGVAWLVRARRGLVPSMYFAVGAAAGAVTALWPAFSLPSLAGTGRGAIAAQILLVGLFAASGIWSLALGLRRVFPRPARATGAAAVILAVFGVLFAPMLLLQPGVAETLRLIDPRPQLTAGLSYWTVGTALLVAPFAALATLPGTWFERGWRHATTRVMAIPDRRFAAGVAIVALSLALVFTWYSFGGRPTTADEIAQLWHARILLSGRLALPADPNPEFFAIDNIIDRPLWMSQFPIGGPAVLALGVSAGAVWLVNPVLTALTALNVYRFGQRAFGEAQARAAAAVFVASPMVLIMGATQMNHTPTAFLVTLAMAALPIWVSTGDAARLRSSALLLGAAIGAAFTVRPLDAVIAALAIGLLMLRAALRDRARARSLLFALAAGLVPVSLALFVNWRTTGDPLRFGYELLWGANHSLGLHDDPVGNPHTAWRAFLLGLKYLAQLNWIAEAWPVPIVLVVAAGLACMRRPRRWDRLLIGLFAAQLVAYAFYWHDGQFVGPRFLFSALPAFLILAARAPFLVADRVSGTWWRIVVIVVPVCIGVSWLRSMSPFGVQGIAGEFRESRRRLKVEPPPQVRDGTVRNALIFVQEGAATRLLRRLWGLSISRADAARLLADSDACSLLDLVREEERRGVADSAGRTLRISQLVRPFTLSPSNLRVPDRNFRVTDSSMVTPACAREIAHDRRIRNTVAYGPMLLENRVNDAGRVDGAAVYVMDLGERNELLRARFGQRRWFRYEVPPHRADTVAALVPYVAGP